MLDLEDSFIIFWSFLNKNKYSDPSVKPSSGGSSNWESQHTIMCLHIWTPQKH